jgi:hypothetical protein
MDKPAMPTLSVEQARLVDQVQVLATLGVEVVERLVALV